VNIPIAIAMLALSIIVLLHAAPELRFNLRSADPKLIRPILSFSWSVSLMSAAFRIETKTDELVVGAILSVSSVAPYALARKLSEAPQLLTEQFRRVLLPVAAELNAVDTPSQLRFLYLAGTRVTLAIHMPLTCTIAILAGPLLTVWVGAAYAPYANLVVILAISSLIITSQRPGNSVLQVMGRHRPLAFMAVCSAVTNLALSIMLGHILGLTGVAIGTLVPTIVVYLGVVLPYAMRVIRVPGTVAFREVFLPALAPALPAAAILLVLQRSLDLASLPAVLAASSAGLGVYAVCYLSLAATSPERKACGDLLSQARSMANTRLRRLAAH
jgi:O-antigen/teichoic acid export membrane protein